MYTLLRGALTASVILAFATPSPALGACTEPCAEVSSFVATLNDFRTSTRGNNRRITATVSFQNKTDRPLILGYVADSGVAIDEHGNRYTVRGAGSGAVRGIGEIERNTFDPKFTLQPGERSDGRFELNWYAGKNIAGVTFELDLAIREIDAVTGDQYKLGREHALRFSALRDGTGAKAAPVPAAAPTASNASSPANVADPCAGRTRCYATGPIVAEIVQLLPSQDRSNHAVRINVRFRNVSDRPVILAYQQNSGVMLDNYGQRYTVDWRNNANVSGIGQTTRQKADPQFVLQPGEARSATLNYTRYVGKTAIGTVFSPDFVVQELEILPSNQIRPVRDYNVSFSNVAAGGVADAVNSLNDAGKQLGESLKSIFRSQ